MRTVPRPAVHELNAEVMRFVRLLKGSTANAPVADRSALLLLWPLLHHGPMRLRDLAAAKGSDASTVSRQAAQLVKAGLVRRDIDPDDRRACLLAVTDGGRAECQRIIDQRLRSIAEALKDWEEERVIEFTRLFSEFNSAVEVHQNTGGNAT